MKTKFVFLVCILALIGLTTYFWGFRSSSEFNPSKTQPDELIEAHYPAAAIVAKVFCPIGERQVDSWGYLVLKEDGGAHVLLPLAVVEVNGEARLLEIGSRITYSYGAGGFLDEFVSYGDFEDLRESLAENYRLKCADLLDDDDLANEQRHFQISDPQALASAKESKHLCFAASDMYNNWACFWYNDRTGAMELSFAQFFSD